MASSGIAEATEAPTLWRLILKNLPIFAFASGVLAVVTEFTKDNAGTGAQLITMAFLLTYAIQSGLPDAGRGYKNPFGWRGVGAAALAILLGIGVAVAIALQIDAASPVLVVIGCIMVSLPISLAVLGPWVLRNVSPHHRIKAGGLWGRIWRMTLIGALPIILPIIFFTIASKYFNQVFDAPWSSVLFSTLTSTLANLALIAYAWALCRRAERVAA